LPQVEIGVARNLGRAVVWYVAASSLDADAVFSGIPFFVVDFLDGQ
jgi:hypothetical protein